MLVYAGEENFTKSFLRVIDNDQDGILTIKEMKEFSPCPQYDGKKLMREFKEYGPKPTLTNSHPSLPPNQVTAILT